MDITYQINLDSFQPLEIVDLYEQNIITLNEIIVSEVWMSEFGSIIKDLIKREFITLGLNKDLAKEYHRLIAIRECPQATKIA